MIYLKDLAKENRIKEIFQLGNILTLEYPVTDCDKNVLKTKVVTGMVYKDCIVTTNGLLLNFDNDVTMLGKDEYHRNIDYKLLEAVDFLIYPIDEKYAICSFIRVLLNKINTANDATITDSFVYKKINI